MRLGSVVALLIGLVIPLAACTTPPASGSASERPSQAQPIRTIATSIADADALPLRIPIRGVMAGVMDFSAHGVFESATSDMPLTDKDWLAAGLASINLIGSATLITMPGTGPHDSEWVADPEWRRRAQEMQSASIAAGVGITKKDRTAFLKAADRLAVACQSCHDRFRPEAPLTNSQFAENVRLGLKLDH